MGVWWWWCHLGIPLVTLPSYSDSKVYRRQTIGCTLDNVTVWFQECVISCIQQFHC